MKKDLYTLIINSILAVCITVGVVLGAPKASVISNSKAVDVFSPSQIFSQIKDKYNKNNTDDIINMALLAAKLAGKNLAYAFQCASPWLLDLQFIIIT